MTRLIHALLRRWPVWTALASTALVEALSWLVLSQPATDCTPGEILAGCGEAPPVGALLRGLGIEAAITFTSVLLLALLVRWLVRMGIRVSRRPIAHAAPAAPFDESGTAHTGWWRRHQRIAGSLLALVIFGAGVGADHLGLFGPTDASDFGLIRQAWDVLHHEYVGAADLDSSDMAHAAIRAMTEAVGDTDHTAFLTPEEAAAEEEDLSSAYVGIGIDLDDSGAMPVVTSVVTDGPADRAGLQAGDRIADIDGASTHSMSYDELVAALRGADGSQVTLLVERSGDRPISVQVTRAVVAVSAVDWVMVPGTSVALVQLAIFSDGAADDLAQALTQIHSAKATGIVLDLRGNPGGKVNEAVGVASEFLASGVIVQSRDATGVVRSASVDQP